MNHLHPPKTATSASATTKTHKKTNNGEPTTPPNNPIFFEDIDSACSTPFVSAPSSPGRTPPTAGGGGFFYSAPTSPMHFLLSTTTSGLTTPTSSSPPPGNSDFDFSATSWYSTTKPMSSADELFLNGEIRPMTLSTQLQLPHNLPEENSDAEDNDWKIVRGRPEVKLRNRSLRRIRSMSPLRTESAWREEDKNYPGSEIEKNEEKNDFTVAREDAPPYGSSSRSSSVGRNSKKWVLLEFLYRSKSEGRNNGRHKYFWSKDKKTVAESSPAVAMSSEKGKVPAERRNKAAEVVAGKRRAGLSAHELHYTTNRAVSEEMKKKTFLPYRRGLFGCLGFNSKGYGAMNGFARALNFVSSS